MAAKAHMQNASPPDAGTAPGRSAALRTMLVERRRNLRAELEAVRRQLREEQPLEAWDEGDRAEYGLNRKLRSARVDRLVRMLQQIHDALSRHAEGRYRRCAACGGGAALPDRLRRGAR
jgi:RNA polymerase-binding transcription factor DksA